MSLIRGFTGAKPGGELSSTMFGETLVAPLIPVVQISAQYANQDDLNIINSNGGFNGVGDSLYYASSGTDPLGLSSVNAKKQATYKPGQGLIGRVSAIFDTPQVGTLQAAGLITSEDSFAFGYLGAEFGILRAYGGVVEAQEFFISNSGSGTLTFVINSIGYDVPITSGTVEHNAWEIAEYFRLNPAENYLITSNENTVYLMNRTPGPQGVFAYSGGGAFAGTFVQDAQGVDVSIELVPQSEFNQDAVSWLNPQSGNVYEIQFAYLGFSGVQFYIKNPETNTATLVHIYKYGNENAQPIVRNPTFRVGWVARNLGNGVNVTVKGASAMTGIQGVIVNDNVPRAVEKEAVSVGQTQTNLITLRNRFHFGDIINRAAIKPLLLSFATDDTRGALFRITANADFSGDMNFKYIDQQNSITEVCYDETEVSGGRFIASFSVTRESPLTISSADFATRIEPDQYFTISAAVKSGASDEMEASVVFIEDI